MSEATVIKCIAAALVVWGCLVLIGETDPDHSLTVKIPLWPFWVIALLLTLILWRVW